MPVTAADIIRAISYLTSRDRFLIAVVEGERHLSEPHSVERALIGATAVLKRNGSGYGLVGQIAVAVHTGHPQATPGVSLAVRSKTDREGLGTAFLQSDFTLRGCFERRVNLLHAMGDPVQLSFDATFDHAIARAETHPLAETTIRIVRREDLITLKERAAADPRRSRSRALRDRLDLELLRGDAPYPNEGW